MKNNEIAGRRPNRRLSTWFLVATVLLTLTACGGGGDAPPNLPTKTCADFLEEGSGQGCSTTSSKALTSAGGEVVLDGIATVSFASGDLSSTANITVESQDDPDNESRFEEGTGGIPIEASSAREILIEIPSGAFVGPTLTVTLTVPTAILERIVDGAELLAMTEVLSGSDDEGDDLVSYEGREYSAGSGGKVIHVVIPFDAIGLRDDGTQYLVLKLAVVAPPADSFATATSAVSKKITGEASPPLWVNPLGSLPLRITGPFGEKFGHKDGKSHAGLDFATTPTQVTAVKDGYISEMRYTTIRPKCLVASPDDPAFDVFITHYDRTRSRYLHLQRGSAHKPGDSAATLTEFRDLRGQLKALDQGQWEEPNKRPCPPDVPATGCTGSPNFPIKAGQTFALSGKTGTCSEHLHFEASERGNGLARNPLMLIARTVADVPPDGIQLTDTAPTALVKLFMEDAGGTEIKVRRNKNPETYLPVTVHTNDHKVSSGPTVWPADSLWPTTLFPKNQRPISVPVGNSPALDLVVKSFPDYQDGGTDGGNIEITKGSLTGNGAVRVTLDSPSRSDPELGAGPTRTVEVPVSVSASSACTAESPNVPICPVGFIQDYSTNGLNPVTGSGSFSGSILYFDPDTGERLVDASGSAPTSTNDSRGSVGVHPDANLISGLVDISIGIAGPIVEELQRYLPWAQVLEESFPRPYDGPGTYSIPSANFGIEIQNPDFEDGRTPHTIGQSYPQSSGSVSVVSDVAQCRDPSTGDQINRIEYTYTFSGEAETAFSGLTPRGSFSGSGSNIYLTHCAASP